MDPFLLPSCDQCIHPASRRSVEPAALEQFPIELVPRATSAPSDGDARYLPSEKHAWLRGSLSRVVRFRTATDHTSRHCIESWYKWIGSSLMLWVRNPRVPVIEHRPLFAAWIRLQSYPLRVENK